MLMPVPMPKPMPTSIPTPSQISAVASNQRRRVSLPGQGPRSSRMTLPWPIRRAYRLPRGLGAVKPVHQLGWARIRRRPLLPPKPARKGTPSRRCNRQYSRPMSLLLLLLLWGGGSCKRCRQEVKQGRRSQTSVPSTSPPKPSLEPASPRPATIQPRRMRHQSRPQRRTKEKVAPWWTRRKTFPNTSTSSSTESAPSVCLGVELVCACSSRRKPQPPKLACSTMAWVQ
mmetsp:Transcript_18030/g.68361  ORF Transcript_18030/g.68361 Transcript_18030/m.68361 type:complete len:228 (+) Transcript_18030:1216-1899(+)